ncbi:MAG: hypothetical protein J2P54_00195 [Bradyrhizobiaceae bacterium]|nr:hypothetical protein [Bradyrhizobiaceae bacterium]
MTTDIVERLRAFRIHGFPADKAGASEAHATIAEAADEIERLRNENARLASGSSAAA